MEYGIYDAIILDIMMPKVDGLTVVKKMRKAENNTPVLMLTAKAETDDKVLGLDAGAFGLVRFRSAPGKAKEICIIFIAMATGLAFGMGYILYGTLFTLICGSALMNLNKVNIWERKTSNKERIYKITILEDVDYINEFSDVFNEYTSKCELIKVKMINIESMFRLTYKIILKDDKLEKEFIDAIRTRNSNLEIISERLDLEYSDCDL